MSLRSEKGEAENEFALGVSRDFNSTLTLGLEAKGEFEGGIGLGPTIALVQGTNFLSLGCLLGVDDDAKDLVSRMIIGIKK